MPATVCPHCGVDVNLNAEDMGEAVECPVCQKAFTAPLPVARRVKRPRRPRLPSVLNDDTPPGDLIRHAESECRGAADGLFALGVLSVFCGLIAATASGIALFGGPNGEAITHIRADTFGALYFGYALYALLIGVFKCYAAKQLQRAKHYSLCVIACVIALIPGFTPCIFSLFFALTGLMKLRDPWVKKGFAANRPGYDPDTPT